MFPIQAGLQHESNQWLHQQHRYEVLSYVYRRTDADCTASISCADLADELVALHDEVLGILHELALLGYLAFVDSESRVRLKPRALSYLLLDSGRRRSIRDPLPH